ncbi:cysteine synthase A [Chitinivorax tropicus]|uniref:Cysteine synthase A n=1 Tax=Chitinivorax tropicus TaxID=714531 RepID=A0A840MHR8_9PROT|nr:pyridoxal-phosphate dependent enzyme [Chitinivorax tropicus]MBB5017940.1 cysteine synthase A [Chitinivorax tropicus]
MFDHIADAIKTPALIRLGDNLYVARFETMKVYSTLVAVERLMQTGVVKPGDTLLDSSSGIYAYALALACHKFGMRCHIIASKTVEKTLMTQLQILGATVEQVPPSATLKLDQSQRVARIKTLLASNPEIHWMRQYHDDIHYAGYEPVAELIQASLGTKRLSVVGGVGSGCSTGGLIQALRRTNDDVELIGVQPFGSMTFHCEHIEDPGIIIAGIGTSIPFRNVRHALYDQIHWVSFDHGLAGSVALLRNHAIFAGLSSGCCHLVAWHEALRRPEQTVLFIAPDTGHRYVDGVYAHHRDARDMRTLAPKRITRTDELALPWSAMAWCRRPPQTIQLTDD